ncbi:MAG: UPF0182 family protein [Candidatus Thiodiazotropha sp.]
MYLLLLLILVAPGTWAVYRGYRHHSPLVSGAGVAWILATLGLFSLLDLWGELLWFQALGYTSRFWRFLIAQCAMLAFGGLVGFLGVYLLNTPLRRRLPQFFPWAELAGALGGATRGLAAWQSALLYLGQVPAGIEEPILHLDAGFYLFTLPLLDHIQGLLLWIATVVLASALLARLLPLVKAGTTRSPLRTLSESDDADGLPPLAMASLALGLAVAFAAMLGIFRLLYSEWGVVAGPGWTDVHVHLPAYLFLMAASLILPALPLSRRIRQRIGAGIGHFLPQRANTLSTVIGAWSVLGLLWWLGIGLLPSLFQWLVVEPNEITYEKPYIANNIRFTRHGFKLHKIEERQFPARESLSRKTVEQNRQLLSEVRLWDWRALDAVYQQFQEIRLYYEFPDVDVDRYTIDGRYRQVMVSAREMEQRNLPAQSQTFVNRRFKYTHGYGLTLATVSDFTSEGLPNLLVKDIPPKAKYPSLQVEQPRIYYGELTRTPVVVNGSEPEFDHPSGDKNAYTRYAGSGGVKLDSLWRKFLFGWKFDGTRFLFSAYPTRQSRILFHRQVSDRVHRLAPFLTLDSDPYIVLSEGRLYWIIDAYTTSDHFPYSEPFQDPSEPGSVFGQRRGSSRDSDVSYLDGVNYLRNAVKVTIDAYDGDVRFYVFDAADPVIRTWQHILPGMFRPRDEMPPGLRAHVRYPQGLLLTQGLVYAKYHMSDPTVFYNQEDLWVRATEKHYQSVQAVDPYYVMWQLPGTQRTEFSLMLPFTPKHRQLMIGWIAGLSDGNDYGRFLAYKFPKERRVLGPQQVETKIDQDSYLSGQLTLWDQRGSKVIRGNVLAIPLDDTLLYVEPIYLQAETAAYPELRLVVVMNGDKMNYAPSFEEALQGLFSGTRPQPGEPAQESTLSMRELGRRAQSAFQDYLKAQGEGEFEQAAKAMAHLQSLLSRMAGPAKKTHPDVLPGGPEAKK